MKNYDWKDVEPRMKGMWQKAMTELCGWNKDVFSKRHQACPECGGKDRFRYTDEYHHPGDGAAICTQCGSGSGMYWFQKVSDLTFCDAVNTLGAFINAEPVEYVAKANKMAMSAPAYKYGKRLDDETIDKYLSCCVNVAGNPFLSLGITPNKNQLYFLKDKEVGFGSGSNWRAIEKMSMVDDQGIGPDLCNIAMIDEDGNVKFRAGDMTYGSASRVQRNPIGNIMLCTDWITARHCAISSLREVWCVYKASNIPLVNDRYRGDRQLVVACEIDDFDSVDYAEDCGLSVCLARGANLSSGFRWTPVEAEIISKKMPA